MPLEIWQPGVHWPCGFSPEDDKRVVPTFSLFLFCRFSRLPRCGAIFSLARLLARSLSRFRLALQLVFDVFCGLLFTFFFSLSTRKTVNFLPAPRILYERASARAPGSWIAAGLLCELLLTSLRDGQASPNEDKTSRESDLLPTAMDLSGSGAFMWGAALLLPGLLTTALCIFCRRHPRVRIPEVDDYEPKPSFEGQGFTILGRHPYTNSSQPPQMSPFLPLPSALPQTRSRISLVNTDDKGPVGDDDYVNEAEIPGEGYIEVLPDPPQSNTPDTLSHTPARSSCSSVGEEDYVNLNLKENNVSSRVDSYCADNGDYENVKAKSSGLSHSQLTLERVDSEDDDYVNNHVSAPAPKGTPVARGESRGSH
ncbi:uncharacterized protein LOC120536436 isoform X2 [Polypterus senegalus]|uniref:uncharacterized protein LOC120536436 isoform X2 n=1 Tax=Polypterus senegalus TaxID=55291 RepID=UPI001962A62C|nr:uncharacterized protein LOC120536436 isoform X2 [Polypterus senegalus]